MISSELLTHPCARAGKDSLLRTQVKGTIIPGILGVGEPLIYGVTLPRVKPFITACCGGSLGGFVVGLISWMGLPVGLNTVFGPSGIVALPLMTSAQGIFPGMMVYGLGLAVAYFGGYLNDNIRAVQAAFGFDAATWYRLARNSFEASFATDAEKAGWIARLDAHFAAAGVPPG